MYSRDLVPTAVLYCIVLHCIVLYCIVLYIFLILGLLSNLMMATHV